MSGEEERISKVTDQDEGRVYLLDVPLTVLGGNLDMEGRLSPELGECTRS